LASLEIYVFLLIATWAVMPIVPVSAQPEFQRIAARYLEVRGDAHSAPRTSEWYFTRDGDRVEIGSGSYVELWSRDGRGEVSWQRIFHDDRKLVDYTPGELRAQHRDLSWATLNTIVDAKQVLNELRRVEKASYLDHAATRYERTTEADTLRVVWLDQEQLPGRIERRQSGHVVYTLTLQELLPAPAGQWPRADLARARDYELVDGSDLGDRENDPFVRKVLAMDGYGHRH
jgi:hypothetical protein